MASKIDGVEEDKISRLEEGTIAVRVARLCPASIVACIQKFMAEVIGTYFVIFAGCGSVAVNKIYGGSVTFPGICVVWGLIVMVMIYTVGHISGAHFNPSVTITLAIFRGFPWWQVPIYIVAQVSGSLLASCTLDLVFDVTVEAFYGTVPAGSNVQSFVLEIIITFLLLFVVFATSNNTGVGELGGVIVGMTILLNVFVAGPISGASMNPARTLGPAIVRHEFRGLWAYIAGPLIGALAGGFVFDLVKPIGS
ncbi:probable aquaporin NIP-type [Momordica charantia]|uniref:Probable aquaporin NIP-type n=1 Tax=Momordica charantia TaxID=3673 RepID=A0A6J1CQD3_MOMCH|nr:probable aquaporin NIP-type [Momordica charantia]